MVPVSNVNLDGSSSDARQPVGPRHTRIPVNGLGPPPDLVRPVVSEAASVFVAESLPHRNEYVAHPYGCQVCGVGTLHVDAPPAPTSDGVIAVPPNNGQHAPLLGAVHPVPAPVYRVADAEIRGQRLPADSSAWSTDPLPDLVNAHRVPATSQSRPPMQRHDLRYLQRSDFSVQQLQQNGGAETMMHYDDPARCWLSQCSAPGPYRHASPNPLVQYAASTSAAAFREPVYHQQLLDDGN